MNPTLIEHTSQKMRIFYHFSIFVFKNAQISTFWCNNGLKINKGCQHYLERNFPMNRTIPVRIRFRRIFRELVGSKVFTVWKLRKFTLTLLLQKFRESNVLLMNSLNSWFDEIFFGEREFHVFSHCGVVKTNKIFSLKKNPWNQFKVPISRTFCKKFERVK